MTTLQTDSLVDLLEGLMDTTETILGLAILAAALAAVVALAYRWYATERIPSQLALLVGLSGVALYLNTTTVLGQVIGGQAGFLSTRAVLFNVVAFVASAVMTSVGRQVGDRVGGNLLAATRTRDVERDLNRFVRAVGRVISVTIPRQIDDVFGYDPVSEEVKDQIAGHSFLFPRRLTVGELEQRLVNRLKTDYGVGHVDVDLTEAGDITHLALGRRAAGIGPTLPPETVAVVIRADPAFASRPGDLVEVRSPETGERLVTAELRGVAGDVVTLAVDAEDASRLDVETNYRLLTLPVEPQPHREFTSLLRAADETTSVVSVEPGGILAGQLVGALNVSVVAVRSADGTVDPLPGGRRVLEPGDALSVLGRPDDLRKLTLATSE